MDTKQAIDLIDDLVFNKTERHLSDLQRAIFCDCWAQPRSSYEEIARSHGYSARYLKQDVGPKLWKLISEVCGEKVKKTNFRGILERQLTPKIKIKTNSAKNSLDLTPELLNIAAREEIACNLPPTIVNKVSEIADRENPSTVSKKQTNKIYWGEAPDVTIFYGRDRELKILETWLVEEDCRLVTILGMGGMGKTHLAVKLAQQIQANFNYVYWKSLNHAPSLQQILGDLLEFLDGGKKQDLPVDLEQQLSQLIVYLKQHKCLIILDNLETILEKNIEAEKYQKFFKLLGECQHQSSILLTSREKPQTIALMSGATLPVRCWQLSGLDALAGQELLNLKGCFGKSAMDCKFLIKKYSGNPLALKIVSATIQELFAGNINTFLQQNILVFSEIFSLLEQQFNRLSDLGKTFLLEIAIARMPLSGLEIQQDIYPQISCKQLIETLKSLAQHSLIEQQDNKFSLQPVVLEYLREKIIESVCQEIIAEDLKLLINHALLKAENKEFIKKEQIEFTIEPIIERSIKYLGSHQKLIAKLKRIITQLQHQDILDIGYAAGNILNILCQMNVSLTGEDLSNLAIWQADLQNIELHDINLTNSNLKKSVFPQKLTNILSIAFSHNGKILATGDSNGEIYLWSLDEYKLIKTYQGHAGWVFSLAFSPDDSLLASASSDGTIKLWQIERGLCLRTLLGHYQRVRCVDFHPNGKILASSSSDRTIKIWEIATGVCKKTLIGHDNYVWSVAFSPDGKLLASGSEDKTIKIWHYQTGKCLKTLEGHERWIRSLKFSPKGDMLASGSGDRTIKIWDYQQGKCLQTLVGHTERLRSLSFNVDGKILASGSSDHTIRLWDCQTGQCLKTIHGHNSRLGAVAFHPYHNILASGGEDRAIKLWDIPAGRCLKTWQGHASWIQSVAFSPDGKLLASGSENCKIELWSWEKNRYISKDILLGHQGWVCAVAFNPDGNLLASASSDYTIKLWDLATGKCRQTFKGHTRWIRTVAFSPDGQQLVSGSGDYSIKLWNVNNPKYSATWQGHTGWIWSVVFSPDGKTVASASEDKTIRLWDVATGKVKLVLDKHKSWVQSLAFSPDGKTLASGSCDKTIILWEVETGKCLDIYRGHLSWVQSVAFSSDGKTLASGSCDCSIRLWDVATGKCQQTLMGHKSWVWSVMFNAQGTLLVSGSQDESIKLWDIQTGKCQQTLRNKRPLEGVLIKGITGLSQAEINTLQILGAVDNNK